jgi:hypothetical protein
VARIAGVNIPTNKRVLIALQYIHGIGQKNAADIMEKVKIPLERRVSHDGLVSIGGNYYSVPDRTRRLVEVHQLADCIRILDEGRLVASHPVLEGRRQYRIDPAHRQGAARHAARKRAPDIVVGRLGDHVVRRSLDFYQAVAERLAIEGSRS